MMQEKFKMPNKCNKFIEDNTAYRIMLKTKNKCSNCKYVKKPEKIEEIFKND